MISARKSANGMEMFYANEQYGIYCSNDYSIFILGRFWFWSVLSQSSEEKEMTIPEWKHMTVEEAQKIVNSIPTGFSGFVEEFPEGYFEAWGFLEGFSAGVRASAEIANRHIQDHGQCRKCDGEAETIRNQILKLLPKEQP